MKWLLRGFVALVVVLVVAFFVFRTPDTDPAQMRAKYGAPPSQFYQYGEKYVVHYRDEGPRDGQAIVLLHGSNADLHTWQPWVDRLKDEYRVIRFDQIGHGLTGPSVGSEYTLADYVETIGMLADGLDLDRFVLAGNSMGGAIAIGYAMEHPERLDGLVLVDAGGADIAREGSGNLAFTLARIPVVNQLAFQVLPRSVVERSLSQSVERQDIVTPEMVDRYWELARYPGNREATMKRFANGWTIFDAADVAKVDVPTLVMWGEEDSLIPYEAADWYMQNLPDATLVNYPGIGHLPQEEHPDVSATDLKAWLDKLYNEAGET